ncbi:hypothetical protein [Albidovulum sediminis]|uniref:Uncharacterized protein n=1 Tax=Albidovulum sediminis TaxID=3066345 RepID=A0ABT2NSV0_9RHOB|nr:hypothetical protein [Defluviimonas sediminis]MCT8332018.1 hypothetical protein [Defluviimonas sediminis]
MSGEPVNAEPAFTGAPQGQQRFFSLSNGNFRGSLWAFLYCLLIVVVCPLALDLGVSRYAVAAGAFVVLPVVASLLIIVIRKILRVQR